ncbi:MAG: branched-chain amino acid ABC transporter permease [Nitratireductor sp.]|nr:branched-chain amino acid ABC transporter permease [Nitratireductor sp.]
MGDLVLQQLANGLSVGMTYALIALGLTMVFGVLHIVNFAHGEFYMLGGLVTALLTSRAGVPYLACLPAAAILVAAAGWATDRLAVRPVIGRPDGATIVLVATFAAGLIINETVLATLGPAPIRVDGIAGVVKLGPVSLTWQRIFAIVFGILLIAIFQIILRRTEFGRQLRAVAQSDYASRVIGLDVERIKSLTFILAACVAALAGALIAPILSFNAGMGYHTAIHGFVVVVIGTMGSIPGAVICGLGLGLLESVASIFIGQEIASACIYALLIVTLLFRPNGVFSRSA